MSFLMEGKSREEDRVEGKKSKRGIHCTKAEKGREATVQVEQKEKY